MLPIGAECQLLKSRGDKMERIDDAFSSRIGSPRHVSIKPLTDGQLHGASRQTKQSAFKVLLEIAVGEDRVGSKELMRIAVRLSPHHRTRPTSDEPQLSTHRINPQTRAVFVRLDFANTQQTSIQTRSIIDVLESR